MPQITLADPEGYIRKIDSSDPEIVARWLLEQARRMVTMNSTHNWRIYPIYPLLTWDVKAQAMVPDWPVGDIGGGSGSDVSKSMMEKIIRAMSEILEDFPGGREDHPE